MVFKIYLAESFFLESHEQMNEQFGNLTGIMQHANLFRVDSHKIHGTNAKWYTRDLQDRRKNAFFWIGFHQLVETFSHLGNLQRVEIKKNKE